MAIDHNGLRFLLLAQADGVSFARTTTLGRLSVYIDAASLVDTFAGFGRDLPLSDARRILETADGYADLLFRHLGAHDVQSLDASAYQKATITLDLNQPLPASLRRTASALVDFGTLEHVFDAPRALANCMEMVDWDGQLLVCSPTDQNFGHGFYQFGPEFYFRALTPENGFQIRRVLLCQNTNAATWWELIDPAVLGRRAQPPPDTGPMSILVSARRVNDNVPFATMPQQSDYEAAWQSTASRGRQLMRRYVPAGVRQAIKARIAGPPAPGAELVPTTPEALAGRRAVSAYPPGRWTASRIALSRSGPEASGGSQRFPGSSRASGSGGS